jgi:hypothetical protein
VGFYEPRKASTLKNSIFLILILVTTACASSTGTYDAQTGTREVTRFAVLHEGPEIAAIVARSSGGRSVGEEWLVLAVELTAMEGTGPVVVTRDEITVRTPDGRRLTVASQNEFRQNYPRLQIPTERTLANLPLLDRYKLSRDAPCSQWFFAVPPEVLTFDEIPISSSQICSGPLIFAVPGGIQPGRWRLIVELQESRADIPFMIEIDR